ncbi:hypothetical protein GQ54DRAFT_33197 [Martensiomyces pterosporus]|nr:hypothetical protein GQ54DRAFT_33197 [Martensiomyces pterosporus]
MLLGLNGFWHCLRQHQALLTQTRLKRSQRFLPIYICLLATLFSMWLPAVHAFDPLVPADAVGYVAPGDAQRAIQLASNHEQTAPAGNGRKPQIRDAVVTGTTTVYAVTTRTIYAGYETQPPTVHTDYSTQQPTPSATTVSVFYSVTTVYITSTWVYASTYQSPVTVVVGYSTSGMQTVNLPVITQPYGAAQSTMRLYDFIYAAVSALVSVAALLLA